MLVIISTIAAFVPMPNENDYADYYTGKVIFGYCKNFNVFKSNYAGYFIVMFGRTYTLKGVIEFTAE